MPASYGHLPIKLLFQIMEGRLTNGNASLNELFHFPVIKKEFSQNWAEMEDSKVNNILLTIHFMIKQLFAYLIRYTNYI